MSLSARGAIIPTILIVLSMAGCGKPGESQLSARKFAAPETASASAPMASASGNMAGYGGTFPLDGAPQAPPADASMSGKSFAGESHAPTADPMPRKIIYTATMEMNTTKFKDSVDSLIKTVKAKGGYIAETNVYGTGEQPKNGTWKVRIPVAQYDDFLVVVGGIGEVTNSSSNSEDVSEEFYDIQARLKNKRLEETRLLKHLQVSTGKLSEILTVEKEISRVREEIEQMEGRMRFLAHQADFTTVTINIHELQSLVVHKENAPTFGTQIGRSFTTSLAGIGAFTKAIVLFVAFVIPWLVISAGIVVPVTMILKKRRDK